MFARTATVPIRARFRNQHCPQMKSGMPTHTGENRLKHKNGRGPFWRLPAASSHNFRHEGGDQRPHPVNRRGEHIQHSPVDLALYTLTCQRFNIAFYLTVLLPSLDHDRRRVWTWCTSRGELWDGFPNSWRASNHDCHARRSTYEPAGCVSCRASKGPRP
jgi:hypothetical protein